LILNASRAPKKQLYALLLVQCRHGLYTINTEKFSSLKHCLCTKTFVMHSKIVIALDKYFQDKMQFQMFEKYFIDNYIIFKCNSNQTEAGQQPRKYNQLAAWCGHLVIM
jgi:hypothetical protein